MLIRFMDCNYPGVVYTGTQAHMDGLGREGGCPSVVGPDPIRDEDGVWTERMAPDFWAEPDEG